VAGDLLFALAEDEARQIAGVLASHAEVRLDVVPLEPLSEPPEPAGTGGGVGGRPAREVGGRRRRREVVRNRQPPEAVRHQRPVISSRR
jgi:hypothetical protein